MLPHRHLNYSQSHLLKQIQKYLELRKHTLDEADETNKIILSFSKGYCSGLTALVLYSLWLESQVNSMKKKDEAPKDNWTRVKHAFDTISSWDTKTNLKTTAEKNFDSEVNEFEFILSYIRFFQHISEYLPVGQGDLHRSFEDTKKNDMKLQYSLAGLFKPSDLTKEIKLNEKPTDKLFKSPSTISILGVLLQPGHMTLISSHLHDIGIINCNGIFYFYDSNSETGPEIIGNNEILAKRIFQAFKYEEKIYSPIGFRVFNLGQHRFNSVPQSTILAQTEWMQQKDAKPDAVDLKHTDNCSPLHTAAWIGCGESLRFYQDRGFNINAKCINTLLDDEYSVLATAIYQNHADQAKQLLLAGVKVTDEDISTSQKYSPEIQNIFKGSWLPEMPIHVIHETLQEKYKLFDRFINGSSAAVEKIFQKTAKEYKDEKHPVNVKEFLEKGDPSLQTKISHIISVFPKPDATYLRFLQACYNKYKTSLQMEEKQKWQPKGLS